jgi:hypothetical protein
MVHVADRGPTVFVVSLVTVTLATVFTLLRFISKWGITKKSNADDYLVIVAWVSWSTAHLYPCIVLNAPTSGIELWLGRVVGSSS